MNPSPNLIASRRHLGIVLGIIGGLTLAGVSRSGVSVVSTEAPGSRIGLYAVLIVVQLAWARYIAVGLRSHGHSLSLLTGGRWRSPRVFVADVLVAAAAFLVAGWVGAFLKSALGGVPANTAFLLPHSIVERVVWVLVSITAGVCDEIVYRGYLQRQFAASTGSTVVAVILQAIAFGISHGYQGWAPMATTGAYGLVLGLVAWWRGNVKAPALAHAATDIVAGLVLGG